jgi:hypothetical protein
LVAAAVTAFATRAGAGIPMERHQVRQVSVTIDRPFGFAAVDVESGLVVVAGWVSEPATIGGS